MREKVNGRILLAVLVTIAVLLAFAVGSLRSARVEAITARSSC